MTYRSRKTVIPPVAAAKVVFIATWAAKAPSLPDFIVRVEPGLKPYHPNQRAKVPSTTNGKLWHSNSSGFVKRPFLGPRIVVPARPAAPPVRCTTPDKDTQVTGVREKDTLHFLRLSDRRKINTYQHPSRNNLELMDTSSRILALIRCMSHLPSKHLKNHQTNMSFSISNLTPQSPYIPRRRGWTASHHPRSMLQPLDRWS